MTVEEGSTQYMLIDDIEYRSGSAISVLQTKAVEVLQTPVNWRAYYECDTIKVEHFNLMKTLSVSSSIDERTNILREDEECTARVFIYLLNKISADHSIQYILTLLDDILQEDKTRANIFHNYFAKRNESIWPHFFGFLQRDDIFCVYQDNIFVNSVARSLQMMLRIRNYRATFVSEDGIDTTNTLIPLVADIFCDYDQEKIIRICLALFRKVIGEQNSADIRDCALSLVQCKVGKRLELLSQKDFSHDKELSEDMEYLEEQLAKSVQNVSNLEEYTTELKSGRLEWSLVHKSEKFWRENAVNFTDRNYELLKMLIHLLETSTEPLIISVAIHDIGEFVRHYPRGKQVIEQLGAKTKVMSFLAHGDPNVRYNALISVHKIMVHNWEYLGKQMTEMNDADDKPKAAPVRS